VREAEVNFLVKCRLAEADGDGDEETLRKTSGRGAARKMGVEFFNISGIGEGVAGAEGENGERGGPKDVLGEGVCTGGGKRAPPAGVEEDGLFGGGRVLNQHGQVFAVVGVVRVGGGEPAISLSETCLDGFEIEGVTGGEVAEVLKRKDREKRVFRDTDAKGDIEGGAFIEVLKEGRGQDVVRGFGEGLGAVRMSTDLINIGEGGAVFGGRPDGERGEDFLVEGDVRIGGREKHCPRGESQQAARVEEEDDFFWGEFLKKASDEVGLGEVGGEANKLG
jgi:hypothetical protein